MIVVGRSVMKDLYLTAQSRDDGIDTPVVVEISECCTTMHAFELEVRPGRCAGFFELPASQVTEDGVRLWIPPIGHQFADVVHDVGASDEQVFPPVII